MEFAVKITELVPDYNFVGKLNYFLLSFPMKKKITVPSCKDMQTLKT